MAFDAVEAAPPREQVSRRARRRRWLACPELARPPQAGVRGPALSAWLCPRPRKESGLATCLEALVTHDSALGPDARSASGDSCVICHGPSSCVIGRMITCLRTDYLDRPAAPRPALILSPPPTEVFVDACPFASARRRPSAISTTVSDPLRGGSWGAVRGPPALRITGRRAGGAGGRLRTPDQVSGRVVERDLGGSRASSWRSVAGVAERLGEDAEVVEVKAGLDHARGARAPVRARLEPTSR